MADKIMEITDFLCKKYNASQYFWLAPSSGKKNRNEETKYYHSYKNNNGFCIYESFFIVTMSRLLKAVFILVRQNRH